MKKKKTTYILLVIVALIWGVIIYRLIGGGASPEISINSPMPEIEKKERCMEKPDSVKLSLNYTDPFLKRNLAYKKPSVSLTTAPPPPKVTVNKEVVANIIWPQIDFDGIIESKDELLVMLQINKSSHIIEKGKVEQGISVIAVSQDSILLSYKHEEKYFYKK